MNNSRFQNLAEPTTGVVSEPSEPRLAPLRVHNLLNDLSQLLPILLGELKQGSWLNGYLLAAGMNQIVEDYLHPDPYFLGKVANRSAQIRKPLGPFVAKVAGWIGAVILRGFIYRARSHHLLEWQAELAQLVQKLADLVARPNDLTSGFSERLVSSGESLLALAKDLPPSLLREVIRLPNCFQSFDQQPADLERLVQDFAQRWPGRQVPLVVIGLRTSGSYLGPLCAAFLKAHGYQQVQALTLRPGRRLLDSERAELKDLVLRKGLVLVTDDPPATGAALVRAEEELQRYGIPSHSIILLLALFTSRDTLPRMLQKYPSVLLPWDEWTIHKKLTLSAVQSALDDFLSPAIAVTGIERLPFPDRRWVRDHVRALYQVRLVERASGGLREERVLVRGVGLGYFGEHSLAVAQPLQEFLPEVFGSSPELLYQAEPRDECRLSSVDPGREDTWARAMSAYVVARNRALGVAEDMSLRLFGRRPVWELASNIVSQAFGRGWRPMRILAVDRVVKRLLRAEHPSVIDGSMALSHWFASNAMKELPLKKADFDDRAFGHFEVYCYDPIFDLAGLAMSGQNKEFTGHLRLAYEKLSSDSISPERWLLYQLIHLLELQRFNWLLCRWEQRSYSNEPSWISRALSRAVQSYFTETFFRGLTPDSSGALCAIDIDGVLETRWLGFPSISPSGALTLRALTLHGFRPVLATGRSLDEVRERCRAYGLAGGVAEYGAAVYVHKTGDTRLLLSEQDQVDLDQLRRTIGEIDGVQLDPDYQYCVRAYCLDSAGNRQRLSPKLASVILTQSQVRQPIRVIQGQYQTDLTIARVDKGNGLRILAGELGAGAQGKGSKPLAFAIGDTASDLPMFETAEIAFAPANADSDVRSAGVKILNQPYQSGLALASARLMGHPPGGCAICAGPRSSPETQLLLTILAAHETRKLGRVWRALLLGARAMRL